MLTPQVHADHEAMSQAAADWLAERIAQKPNLLLCMATGATPMRAYELLAKRDPSLFRELRVIKLDEWAGIPMRSPATCETYLRNAFIDPLRLEGRYIAFNGEASDFAAECARIAGWLQTNGPIDLCVLGLGLNGHLGFNEPAPALQPHAHVATLSYESLQHAMIAVEKIRPTAGLTLGIADLLHSRQILLLVSGAAKQKALHRMLNGSIETQFPSTFLRLHSGVTVLCDQAALS